MRGRVQLVSCHAKALFGTRSDVPQRTRIKVTHCYSTEQPSNTQYSELSYLRGFVRDSKAMIINPLFACLENDPLFIEAQAKAEAQAQPPSIIDSAHSMKTPQRCPAGTGYRRLPALRLDCNNTYHVDNTFANPASSEVGLPKLPYESDISLSSAPSPYLPHIKAARERRSLGKAPRPPPSPLPRALPKYRDAKKPVQAAKNRSDLVVPNPIPSNGVVGRGGTMPSRAAS